MERFKIILAVVVLISSIFLLFSKLFSPAPIQITLETGQEITTQNPQYFPLSEVLLLVVSSFLIGGTATYLYYKSDIKGKMAGMIGNGPGSGIAKLLKPDERKVFLALQHSGGEMLQNRLVEKLGLSKVKVTRILSRLEKKGLVTRQRNGFTNKIKIAELT